MLACVVVAVVATWIGVVRRGVPRIVGLAVAVLALLGVVALLFRNNGWPYLVWLVIGVVINPWSGGGKAAKVGPIGEAEVPGAAWINQPAIQTV